MGHPRAPRDTTFNWPGHAVREGHPWQRSLLASTAVLNRAELKEARERAGLDTLATKIIEEESSTNEEPKINFEALQRIGLGRFRHALADTGDSE
jgi:hypothetical protein